MTVYVPDFSKRVHSTQRNSAVSAGYAVDFVHVTGIAENLQIAPARSVVTLLSINLAPSSGSVILMVGNDIVMEGQVARDYKMGFYAYAPVFLSIPDATADVTVYVAPSSKGSTPGQ